MKGFIDLVPEVNYSRQRHLFYINFLYTFAGRTYNGCYYYDAQERKWVDIEFYGISELARKCIENKQSEIERLLYQKVQSLPFIYARIQTIMERAKQLQFTYIRKKGAYIYIKFHDDDRHTYRIDSCLNWEVACTGSCETNEHLHFTYDSISGYFNDVSEFLPRLFQDPRLRLKQIFH